MGCSAASNGDGIELPVAANAAAALPSYLEMAWMSIERVAMPLHILADLALQTGEKIRGRGRDYAHWFKMFSTAQTEQWKSCVFFRDRLYVDVRAQMGGVASAHLGQRTAFLITALEMSHVEAEFNQRMQRSAIPQQVEGWVKRRQPRLEHDQI